MTPLCEEVLDALSSGPMKREQLLGACPSGESPQAISSAIFQLKRAGEIVKRGQYYELAPAKAGEGPPAEQCAEAAAPAARENGEERGPDAAAKAVSKAGPKPPATHQSSQAGNPVLPSGSGNFSKPEPNWAALERPATPSPVMYRRRLHEAAARLECQYAAYHAQLVGDDEGAAVLEALAGELLEAAEEPDTPLGHTLQRWTAAVRVARERYLELLAQTDPALQAMHAALSAVREVAACVK